MSAPAAPAKMATNNKQHNAVAPDTPITIKISVNDNVKKLKLPLRDLGVTVLPAKLRSVLDIKPDQHMILERYSDSVGGYITLDEKNPAVFKTLIRAAKAKLKLRLKATVTPIVPPKVEESGNKSPFAMDRSIAVNVPMTSVTVGEAKPARMGSGIFEFREARASQQTLVNEDAPVPRPFETSVTPPAIEQKPAMLATITPPVVPTAVSAPPPGHEWQVYCNICNASMLNTHFHCSICDNGDYDLCEKCVSEGKVCTGADHWLIKRTISNGKIVNATTERIAPAKDKIAKALVAEPQPLKEMPGAFVNSPVLASRPVSVLQINPMKPALKPVAQPVVAPTPTRTCNGCVIVLPENEFITCQNCDDFDLCVNCFKDNKHGHHPVHSFKPAVEKATASVKTAVLLSAASNTNHSAICDGCDQGIFGVRHKCLNCPDFDYCSKCVKNARHTHPQHRFAPLYEKLPLQIPNLSYHEGIFCDGPLCQSRGNNTYISGVRYKCTICHDVDFCASCEALPTPHHNHTHPLLKLKTPVRKVHISTENSDPTGHVRVMGDRRTDASTTSTRNAFTETVATNNVNTAVPVQTVAEIKPSEVKPIEIVKENKSASVSPAIPVKKFVENVAPAAEVQATQLNAHFVHDSIPDGYVCEPETRFTQVWTLKNPGPHDWPAGCSVRFVGGDNMLDVDNNHPASVADLNRAAESNVVGREVRVGEEIAFKVTLKAGKREGKSISYWRLKANDGTPFGHRLWCDIDVKKPEFGVTAAKLAETMSSMMGSLPIRPRPIDPTMSTQFERIQALREKALEGMPQPQNMSAMHDLQGLNSRIDKMREAQKQRREQMMSIMRDQRDVKLGAMKSAADAHHQLQQNLMRQRVAALKANIEQARAIQTKMHNINEAAFKTTTTASLPIAKLEEEELQSSQMVFPKLEKESPSSSTYQSVASSVVSPKVAYVENDEGVIEDVATHSNDLPAYEPAPSVISTVAAGDEDDFESVDNDIEVMSATGEESEDEDDGFVTDEEYDILDASDDETVASTA